MKLFLFLKWSEATLNDIGPWITQIHKKLTHKTEQKSTHFLGYTVYITDVNNMRVYQCALWYVKPHDGGWLFVYCIYDPCYSGWQPVWVSGSRSS